MREVTRTSIRVRTAMAVQVREQGRYLGGRPPCTGWVMPVRNRTRRTQIFRQLGLKLAYRRGQQVLHATWRGSLRIVR